MHDVWGPGLSPAKLTPYSFLIRCILTFIAVGVSLVGVLVCKPNGLVSQFFFISRIWTHKKHINCRQFPERTVSVRNTGRIDRNFSQSMPIHYTSWKLAHEAVVFRFQDLDTQEVHEMLPVPGEDCKCQKYWQNRQKLQPIHANPLHFLKTDPWSCCVPLSGFGHTRSTWNAASSRRGL